MSNQVEEEWDITKATLEELRDDIEFHYGDLLNAEAWMRLGHSTYGEEEDGTPIPVKERIRVDKAIIASCKAEIERRAQL